MFAHIRQYKEMLHYIGDFDLPKTHADGGNWAGSQNGGLDNWAKVTTDWDMIGGAKAENHIHFDSFAGDAWNAGEGPRDSPPAMW